MAHVMLKRTNEKRKRKLNYEAVIVIDDNEPCDTVLHGKIFHAEGIDQPRPGNSKARRNYRVYASVNPDTNEERHNGVRSKFVRGDPNPCWNASFSIPLGEFSPTDHIGKYLHLELVKLEYGSEDPQPSNREVVVGRTRIRLPNNISQNKSGSFELAKLVPAEDGLGAKPAGQITVSMVLKHELR